MGLCHALLTITSSDSAGGAQISGAMHDGKTSTPLNVTTLQPANPERYSKEAGIAPSLCVVTKETVPPVVSNGIVYKAFIHSLLV